MIHETEMNITVYNLNVYMIQDTEIIDIVKVIIICYLSMVIGYGLKTS